MNDLLIIRVVNWCCEKLNCFKKRKFVVYFSRELDEGIKKMRCGARERLKVMPVDCVFDLIEKKVFVIIVGQFKCHLTCRLLKISK